MQSLARIRWILALALGVAPLPGRAAPLGDPLQSLPLQSVPVAANIKPDNVGFLSGADGDVADPVWVATTDQGYLLFFNGFDPTPVNVVDMGLSGATGVAWLGNNRFAISAGNTIYEGNLSGGTWNQTGGHSFSGMSTINDVDYALGHYFIATASDGVRRVESDWTTTEVYSGNGVLAVKVVEFQPNSYDNPMLNLAGGDHGFRNADSSGTPFGFPKPVQLNNGLNIEGIAYYSGGFAVVQSEGTEIHNPFTFQQHMASMTVPEPSAAVLLLAATPLLLPRRRRAPASQPRNT